MEKFYTEDEEKPENEGKAEDKIETQDEGKPEETAKPDLGGKLAHEGKLEGERQPGVEVQGENEGKLQIQGKSKNEGKPQGESTAASQVQSTSEQQPTGKCPVEDYVPRKAKRKTDRATEDSPRDSQENLQGRHLSSGEVMAQCADMSRAQEELRKKQRMSNFHWMQRELLDSYPPRVPKGVRAVRGGGRGQKNLEDHPYV
ncbi:transcription elongation factor A protein-like 5 [Octodon degus]|uniref:Transcription elongation factor A protein-like 5 n=1 Tax=Octodon degus TaxID=10160 RepID=A0A6P3FWD9_OCTDE|nr:transcription elongation factor A protein-like 5 [Octodon degus]XP_004648433.1 transcription elongation factor A protein-like 5 [Octodon degus]